MAVTQYQKSIRTAFHEVSEALASSPVLQNAYRQGEQKVAALQATDRIARERWVNGGSSAFEYLGTRRELMSAQQELIRLHLQRELNRIALYKALGGGWRASLVNSQPSSSDPS
ncbi:MAG: TolC family protein [Lautropia sp.]|nr:TolC family protein [Lautropia sp.]